MSDCYGYSSHYAQAYYQSFQNAFPAVQWQPTAQSQQQKQQQQQQHRQFNHSGYSKCTYKNCLFTGPPKVLETHMMDRHLIYPSWWDKKKKKQDWDADPTLKGKKIAILGTNLTLDNPEDLAAWIEERKKRWPTVARVEEKKRKFAEAVDRGQIFPNDHGRHSKRQRTSPSERNKSCILAWEKQRSEQPGHQHDKNNQSNRARSAIKPIADLGESDSDDDGPEVVISKKEAESLHPSESCFQDEATPATFIRQPWQALKRQPKRQPYNPFAARPVLLHKLLLPEIRMTISNFSQAIRFLVDNDFLDGVEEIPGAAKETMIQVVSGNEDVLP